MEDNIFYFENEVPEMDNDSSEKMKCTQEEFEKLLINNQNFPYSVVNKEFGKYPASVKQDLNSAAIQGMVYAATKYDPKRSDECKFISYAVHWIRYYINEEIRKLYPVRFNQNFVSKRNKVKNCIKNYKETHNGEEPTTEYIANEVGMSPKVVKNILKINSGENFQFISFNTPTENEKSNSSSSNVNCDKLVKEYLSNTFAKSNPSASCEFDDLLVQLKKAVPYRDFMLFYEYYVNGESFSDLAKKYKLKFPSSVSYLIKKCEKKCKEILSN